MTQRLGWIWLDETSTKHIKKRLQIYLEGEKKTNGLQRECPPVLSEKTLKNCGKLLRGSCWNLLEALESIASAFSGTGDEVT